MTLKWQFAALTLIAFFGGVTAAIAQSATPTEAVQANGSIVPPLALTPAQRNAVSHEVKRQRIHTPVAGIAPTIGAPAAPTLALRDLPDVPALGNDATNLKYATVAGDVVVIDPIGMLVVDVIHSGAGP